MRKFVMKKINVEMKNCYGIKRLDHQFDFTQRKAYAIYAPNGSMKSSFAETFKNIKDGIETQDRIFPKRASVRKITDESGAELPQESILVLPPYDEFFGHTEKTSTLLLNKGLKDQYEKLHIKLNGAKEAFLEVMQQQSASKKDLEAEIALAFTPSSGDAAFYAALDRIKTEVKEQKDAPYADVEYDKIFDDKVLAALDSKDCKEAIKDYISRYNELLTASTYFKRGIFEYFNANQIAKALADNGFFSANHRVTLNGKTPTEISTKAELEKVIQSEFDAITNDPTLKKKFDAIKKLLEKNVTVREFQAYICNHEALLPELNNTGLFKERIWKSYFKKHEAAFDKLIAEYNDVKAKRRDIEEAAKKEGTQWEAAIDLFNERFFVPFSLVAKNKVEVALGNEPMLDLGYTFKDNGDSAPVERDTLLKALSQGEKKALYILNIIFEIEVRRAGKQETLFVVDDIADSFDYKNKYAIIQYLSEIAEGPDFKQIILTHNFDFFRTIESRFVAYSGCLMATKNQTGITLTGATGIRNIFVNDWKKEFFDENKKRIASIPFIRNLIEFTRGSADTEYVKLTSLLHWKADSPKITQAELDIIYHNCFGSSASAYPDQAGLVVDLIEQEAKSCLAAGTAANFPQKIVLSIAIRLSAEKYMVNKLADPTFVSSISENQTHKLLNRFQSLHPNGGEAIKTLRGVLLMTPENIHLNAFMYEPILDMSDDHLRRLYSDVLALT